MFTGASQFALVGRRRGRRRPAVRRRDRAAARHPQHALRPADGAAAAVARLAPGRPPPTSSSTSRPRWRSTAAPPRAPGSASRPPAWRSSCCGTSPPPIGAFAGEAVGDPRTFGLDAAVGAAFLALLWPRLKDRRNILVGVLAAAVALSMVPITAPGVPVLAAGGVAVLVGVLSKRAGPDRDPRSRRRGGRSPLMWTAILLACVGCYVLKLAGLSLPERVLSHPTVERVADLIPVALLAALVAVQVFSDGTVAHPGRPRPRARLRRGRAAAADAVPRRGRGGVGRGGPRPPRLTPPTPHGG